MFKRVSVYDVSKMIGQTWNEFPRPKQEEKFLSVYIRKEF